VGVWSGARQGVGHATASPMAMWCECVSSRNMRDVCRPGTALMDVRQQGPPAALGACNAEGISCCMHAWRENITHIHSMVMSSDLPDSLTNYRLGIPRTSGVCRCALFVLHASTFVRVITMYTHGALESGMC
jgi:hypothetical protein